MKRGRTYEVENETGDCIYSGYDISNFCYNGGNAYACTEQGRGNTADVFDYRLRYNSCTCLVDL